LEVKKIVGIIPARYGSSRFPGKALAEVHGKTIIQRVWEQASKALEEVCIATDDQRIFDHVSSFGKVFMTSAQHKSGTDRCHEVLQNNYPDYDYVINIQGDEPFIDPGQIKEIKSSLDGTTELATLCKKTTDVEELQNNNVVKVVFNLNNRAMYFSRNPIPYIKGKEITDWPEEQKHYKHIGIYAYRADVLEKIARMKISPLENAESLEQLRWLENGLEIRCIVTSFESMGIDTPEDLERAISWPRP